MGETVWLWRKKQTITLPVFVLPVKNKNNKIVIEIRIPDLRKPKSEPLWWPKFTDWWEMDI